MTSKPIVHELRAEPLHADRPWYSIEATTDEVPAVDGEIVLSCTDGVERKATRNGSEIHVDGHLPEGVTVKAWRLP